MFRMYYYMCPSYIVNNSGEPLYHNNNLNLNCSGLLTIVPTLTRPILCIQIFCKKIKILNFFKTISKKIL